jgi:hypothetical protein
LQNEFNRLFESLFENADAYIELVQLIAQCKNGVRRAELKVDASFSSGGGRLTKRLQDLREAGFIEENISWGRSTGEYYKLIDEFCLFYLQWQQYSIDKQYAKNLKKKVEVFKEKTGTKKQVFLAMICACGLKSSIYSEKQIDGGIVTLNDLFKSS